MDKLRKERPKPEGWDYNIERMVQKEWYAGLNEQEIAVKLKLQLPCIKAYSKHLRQEATLMSELSPSQLRGTGTPAGVPSKLSPEQKEVIKKRFAEGETQTALATLYSVHVNTIARICKGVIRE